MICRKTIGQTANAHNIVIDDPRISRRHCSLVWDGASAWLLQDLGSTNGTDFDNQPVLEEVSLESGAEIKVGDSHVVIRFGSVSDKDWRRPAAGRAAVTGNGQTMINLPNDRDNGPDGDRTAVHIADDPGAPAADADATIIVAPSAPDADATIIGTPSAPDVDATILGTPSAPDVDATILGTPSALDVDATILGTPSAPDVDATILGTPSAPDADATVIVSPSAPGADATVLGTPATPAPAENTVLGVASEAKSTVAAPETPANVSDADAAGQPRDKAQDTIISGLDQGRRRSGTVEVGGGADAAAVPDNSLLGEIQKAGLLNADQARAIQRHARESSLTVFSTIVHDTHLTNQTEIIEWAAARAACRHIGSANELQETARSVDWLPFNSAEKAGILLLNTAENAGVEYATIDPFNVLTRDWVARCEKSDSARPVLVSLNVFRDALRLLRRDQSDDDEGEIGIAIEIDWDEAEHIRENLEGQDVPMIVDYIIFRAHSLGASDIHVEPTETRLLIRNRVDGILHEEAVLPGALHPEVASRIKILSGMDVAEKRRPQDGRISISIRQSPIDVRVSTFPTVYGEKIVMRLLDQSSLMPSPNHLGLGERELRLLVDGLNAPYGLIMLCGPTGSGKTTTLYSCLGAIDKTSKNVLTVEDPVEYRLEGVHQMQVNHKIGLTFQQGLRNILRQDPDIIMVGECRDLETAEMAIQASLTGHIVFSTIHTNDAIGVISRLLDMEIDPFLVATALSLSIAQRLVRTICPECKTQIDGGLILEKLRTDGVSEHKLEALGMDIDPDLQYAVGRGRGCGRCRGTGYSGRQAVFEVFEMTNEGRQIIMAEQYNADALRAIATRDGLSTLVLSGLDLVEQGVTTHEEIIRVLGETN